MKNNKCDCCQKELGDITVKKYREEVCAECAVKILDKLSIVESTFKEAINKARN